MSNNGEKKQNKELLEREKIVQIVQDGSKTEYWKILKSVILQWAKEEKNNLDSFQARGITTKNMAEYNRGVDRMEYLRKFLSVNEKIVSHNSSIIVRMKSMINTIISKSHHVFL